MGLITAGQTTVEKPLGAQAIIEDSATAPLVGSTQSTSPRPMEIQATATTVVAEAPQPDFGCARIIETNLFTSFSV